jgi:hypothetical protein
VGYRAAQLSVGYLREKWATIEWGTESFYEPLNGERIDATRVWRYETGIPYAFWRP